MTSTPVPWETLTDRVNGAANIHCPVCMLGDCLACGKPVRWSTVGDEPHWVHTSILDTLQCPPSSLR